MRLAAALALALPVAATSAAFADGFAETGADLVPRDAGALVVSGTLRVRGDLFGNLDLDRGVDAQGRPFFPVPLGDPAAQWLTSSDLRLRADAAAYSPGGGFAIKMRADLPDTLALGTPLGGARGAAFPARLERVYGEALTPLGVLELGRMASDWGLGLLANAGDCGDCEGGDTADRAAFIAPIAGHLWAVAFDLGASGLTAERQTGARTLELAPSAAPRTLTFAVLRWHDDDARLRRRRAGKTTLEYGAFVSVEWQASAVAPAPDARAPTDAQVMDRGLTATALDAWARLTFPSARIEAEATALSLSIAQASLVPGALLREPVSALQYGGEVQSDFGAPESAFAAGLDVGLASGGAPSTLALPDQAPAAGATSLDALHFSPNHRVDRVLFAELMGGVTNAVYVRPHLRLRLVGDASCGLGATLAVIASAALVASATPGGAAPLGVEVDPSLVYACERGFSAALDDGVLLPLSGLDNPAQGLVARPAQRLSLRVGYAF